MNIDELLDTIEETLETGASIPLSGGKRVVDVDKIRDMLDEVRLNLPGEIRQAKGIVNDRAQILSDAKNEAAAIVKKAEDRATVLVSDQEVLKQAEQRAKQMVTHEEIYRQAEQQSPLAGVERPQDGEQSDAEDDQLRSREAEEPADPVAAVVAVHARHDESPFS